MFYNMEYENLLLLLWMETSVINWLLIQKTGLEAKITLEGYILYIWPQIERCADEHKVNYSRHLRSNLYNNLFKKLLVSATRMMRMSTTMTETTIITAVSGLDCKYRSNYVQLSRLLKRCTYQASSTCTVIFRGAIHSFIPVRYLKILYKAICF